MKPISLDAMGGDRMPDAAVDGALLAVREGVPVALVGDEPRLRALLAERGADPLPDGLSLHHAPDAIGMEDHAADVRRRKESSVMVAMRLVKDGAASACVSMGHSGATMAAALLVLGRLKGVERPAILASIPQRTGFVALVDAGANADCRPAHLQRFAVMGSAYARAFHGRADPSVGLVSIGEEPGKGNELAREAHTLLARTPGIRFHGNVEGRDLFEGTVDVFVTDGFTGNVMLKQAEGEARALFGWIREALQGGGPLVRLGALLVRPALRGLAARMDPAEIGAQPLLGVRGPAFIGHGSSDARAVLSGLRTARTAVDARLVEAMRAALEPLVDAPPEGAASGAASGGDGPAR